MKGVIIMIEKVAVIPKFGPDCTRFAIDFFAKKGKNIPPNMRWDFPKEALVAGTKTYEFLNVVVANMNEQGFHCDPDTLRSTIHVLNAQA